jgi:hypothetical protein
LEQEVLAAIDGVNTDRRHTYAPFLYSHSHWRTSMSRSTRILLGGNRTGLINLLRHL